MSKPSLLLLGAAACAEPAIAMRLELPPAAQSEGFQLDCVTSFEVAVRGATRPDDKGGCIQLRAGTASFAELQDQIAGEFDIELPRSELQGVEIRVSSGRCDKVEPAGGDTILYGTGKYTASDDIVIRLQPNQSCGARAPNTVRPIDFLKLAREAPCSELGVTGGSVDAGTIRSALLQRAVFDANVDRADVAGGTATLPLYVDREGSCAALRYTAGSGPLTTESCARRGRGVCTTGAEIELPVIDGGIASRSLDPALINTDRDGAVFGAIWGTVPLSDPLPLSEATIRPVDPDRAKVVYADYPTGAELIRGDLALATTNGTGLFIAYVTEPTDFIVSHFGYTDQIVRLGSPVNPSAAVVVLETLDL